MIQRCNFFYAHVSDFPDDTNQPFGLCCCLTIHPILLISMKNLYYYSRPVVVQDTGLIHGTLIATVSWNNHCDDGWVPSSRPPAILNREIMTI